MRQFASMVEAMNERKDHEVKFQAAIHGAKLEKPIVVKDIEGSDEKLREAMLRKTREKKDGRPKHPDRKN